jgi:glycine oxidase
MSHPDAVVLGGGIIGLACARELAGAGLRVTLLERLHQGAGASKAAAGMLAPLYDAAAEPAFLAACRASRDLWTEWAPALEAEAEIEVDYDRSGALEIALDDAGEEALERTAGAARRLGEPCDEISAADLRHRTPGVAAELRRALLLSGEHRVDNIRVCGALAAACERRGVSLRYAVRILEIRRSGRGDALAVRIETHAGPLETGLLVLAAGAWSGGLPGLPRLPVRPVRGQMALLAGVDWPWRGIARSREVYMVRRGDRELVVGATVEEAGFDSHPTVAGIGGLLDLARRTYPGLGAARLAAVWAGLRPGTPDELPILGWLPGWPALAATGHYRNGILLAPWTAVQIARLAAAAAMTSPPSAALAAFSPARFADPSEDREEGIMRSG